MVVIVLINCALTLMINQPLFEYRCTSVVPREIRFHGQGLYPRRVRPVTLMI